MKKTLLTAFAVAVAFAASAVTLVNERPALTAHELNGSLAAVENVKAKAFKAPAQKAATMDDVVGTYVMYYVSYFDESEAFSEVTIAAGDEENTLIIKGWWGSFTQDLTATLDPDAGTITIPRQLLYEYEGDTSADFVNAADTTAAVVGTVYPGQGIAFSDYWGAKLENMSSFYEIAYNTVFFVPSGTMTWTMSGTDYSTSVYLADGDKSVFVGNLANYGWGVDIDLHAGNTFTIEPVKVTSSSNGDFYLTDIMGWAQNNYTPQAINGTGTETVLTFTDTGNYGFTAGTSTGYWYGNLQNGVITRTDGGAFDFPVAPAEITLNVTDEDEVAILPNGTFQLEVITVAPEGADTEVTWSSSDEHLATVDENGLVTGKEFDGYALKNGLNQAPSDNDHFDYFPVTITATAVESDPTAAAPASASVRVWVKSSTRTAVNEVKTVGVESVKYVNAQGMVSSTPFDGVNIEVTRLSDGTTKTVKVIK